MIPSSIAYKSHSKTQIMSLGLQWHLRKYVINTFCRLRYDKLCYPNDLKTTSLAPRSLYIESIKKALVPHLRFLKGHHCESVETFLHSVHNRKAMDEQRVPHRSPQSARDLRFKAQVLKIKNSAPSHSGMQSSAVSQNCSQKVYTVIA